jgi:two-component system cell cycle sensor histidine kinase/response regulator CckA
LFRDAASATFSILPYAAAESRARRRGEFRLPPTIGDDGDVRVTAGPRPSDTQPPSRETLLVVDDEEMVRRLAARMLVTLGYRVLEARDGQDAVRVLQRSVHRINGVLTDLAMPGIGGRGLGETIARCWPQVPVLYMSGFPAKRMVNEGALDPSHLFIQKPFTSDQLGRKVRELLADRVEQ